MAQFWPRPPKPEPLAGTVAGVNPSVYTTVLFPVGYFTAKPHVTGNATGASSSAKIWFGVVTASSFQVAADVAETSMDWIAIQS